MAHEILLESGTNEMELLVFRLGGTAYGVNVIKVRELVQRLPVISLPHAPEGVAGSIKLREEILSLIDLAVYLKEEPDPKAKGLIIMLEINNTRCGVLVDAVEMIHRLRWEDIDPPSPLLSYCDAPVTAVSRIQDRVVQILDFERIFSELLGVNAVEITDEQAAGGSKERAKIKILAVDDSSFVRNSLQKVLLKAGFGEVVFREDGDAAWEELQRAHDAEEKSYDIVLSDIEMPRVDGWHLTVRLKEDPRFKDVPVVLFSSVVSDDMASKSEAVGASAQVSKSDTAGLLAALDSCLNLG
jgi:two-component system, chemotaxis family, chemotaxis protein CheV